MISKQQFIEWLRQSGNSDNIILAALLEQNIIEMPLSLSIKTQGAITDGNR